LREALPGHAPVRSLSCYIASPKACRLEQSDALEILAMAHREQHSNREAKKPKKEKPKDAASSKPSRWAVSDALEAKPGAKR
jgi:hypothetical protein